MEAEKTPVTILQELMTKIKSIPRYEFHDTVEQSGPKMFSCQVTCDGITTTGYGKSKKEAKQNAASAMLERMGKRKVAVEPPSTFYESPVRRLIQSQTENSVDNNSFIQQLDEQCTKYNIEKPVYKDAGVLGIQPLQTYTVQCIVSTLKVDGFGKTKKLAKIDAAQKMLNEMADFFNLDCSKQDKSEKTKKIGILKNSTASSTSFPVSTVNDLAKLKINYDFKLQSERKELVKHLQQAIPSILSKLDHASTFIRKCQQNICEDTVTQVKLEFQALLELAKLDFHHMLLQTVEPITFMLIIQLNTVPDILEMSLGSTREEAELRTISKVIETLKSIIYQNST